MSHQPNSGKNPVGFPLLTVSGLMAGIFTVGSEELVVSPLLVRMATSFDTTVGVMALSVSVYGAATALGALVFAPLGDRVSRRLSLAVGMAVFILGTVLCACATGTGVFFVGRALAGLAAGAFVPTAYAFVGDRIPYEHRARTMGVLVSSWSLALVLGVPMGAFVGQWVGWRWTFGLLSLLGVLVLLVMLRVGGERRTGTEDPAAPRQDPEPSAGWTRSAARAFLAPRVPAYVLATFLVMLGWYGMYTFLGTALEYRYASGSSLTGVMILLYGLGFASSFVTGRFADRLGKERVLTVALAGLVPALVGVPLLIHWTAPLAVCLFVWGILQSLVVTLLSTLLSESSQRHRGTILAFYSLATNLAVAVGAAALAPLFTAHGFLAVGCACAGVTAVAAGLSGWTSRAATGSPEPVAVSRVRGASEGEDT
ncbi:MFS transporter [Streptomyces sp. ALI-76-A]|uniref:MFS transporter n=1 Tax=Streptomyces sp. ALI-76-A TaxID=3025736 RepID=UPI00256EA30B|nr:MFS transporter [Streptomyces sp. ALI-76-A]MDL5203964.1 MFS transporter [Streptomyces sp. ALI-76-A]